MEFIGSITVGVTMLAGGWMILHGTMRFGDFFVYLFTLSRFYRPLRALATLTNKYQDARVSAERMSQMLRLRPRIHDRPGAVPFSDLRQGIELRGVGFSYADKRILEDISFRVQAGQRIALAGPSGGGKTTLVNMLARLFDPGEGAILIDGIDLRELSLGDWRRHLAIVTQDTFLFDDTVENNIAYGMGRPDSERVQAAAHAANAHEFIMGLDGGLGYQTRIGTAGGRMSGGQRQRLAIARAIYRNPRILILDEATSALDAQSQAVVQEALGRLMTGRTTFVIAHRTSTIRDMDRIYVIDGGRIVEQGSHDQLLEIEGGLYRAMVTKVGLVSEESAVAESALTTLRPQEPDPWAAEDYALEDL
jgi:ABC-type multidrug transport system fused ATPase/permease subunit